MNAKDFKVQNRVGITDVYLRFFRSVKSFDDLYDNATVL